LHPEAAGELQLLKGSASDLKQTLVMGYKVQADWDMITAKVTHRIVVAVAMGLFSFSGDESDRKTQPC